MEGVYYKPNAKIQTKNFGQVERQKYKALVELFALFKIIDSSVKEHDLPIEVSIKPIGDNFYSDYIDRMINGKNTAITTEQIKFEAVKYMTLIKEVTKYTDSIANR